MTDEELIKQAVKELGIDKPIMRHKVVGDRLELYLYGGQTLTYGIAKTPDQPVFLKSKKELLAEAKERGLDVTARMTKAQLIKALKEDAAQQELGQNETPAS